MNKIKPWRGTKKHLLEKLESLERKYKELSEELSSGAQDYGSNVYLLKLKEHKVLEELMGRYEEYKGVLLKISETEELLSVEEDEELKELVREELSALFRQRDVVEKGLKLSLLPKDANEDKNVIMEIRAGTGGDEAALFASDLYRMYVKYADRHVMKVEQLSASPTEGGGYKEVIFSVSGDAVYNKLKFEMGGHRVQRVPVTESSGRIHTSAVTVAVLAEAEETEIEINPNDLRIDVYRSSGPGGQSVNTTDSAVRITHIKYGITVQCQDEKSQHKNKAKAMRVLRARIKDKLEEERAKDLKEERARQIGSGDRSERIRTYNFQQNRMTDHRINYSIYNKLESLLNGEIEEFIEKLQEKEKEDKLKSLT